MAEEMHELSSDELDEVAGGDSSQWVPIESRTSKFIKKLKSEGLTKEEAMARYKDNPGTYYHWIREYWH